METLPPKKGRPEAVHILAHTAAVAVGQNKKKISITFSAHLLF